MTRSHRINAHGTKALRLLRLMQLLNGCWRTVRELAQAESVCEMSIRRDLATLKGIAPVQESSGKGRYSIKAGWLEGFVAARAAKAER